MLTTSDKDDADLEAEIAGQRLRIRGYRVMDIALLLVLLGTAYVSQLLFTHHASAQANVQNLNNAIVDAIRENKESMKANSDATVRALQELSVEQRRSTRAMREQVCLSDPALKNRMDARDLCKRMVSEDRN